MTYVEFYDRTSVENICSSLTNLPDRVVIVGFQSKKIDAMIKICKTIFDGRGNTGIEFVKWPVHNNDLGSAVASLEVLLEKYNDLVFDITGGDPLLTMALGIVLQRHNDEHYQVHRMCIRTNDVIDCDRDEQTIRKDTPKLSVRENILLYKGDVRFGGAADDATYIWNFDDEDSGFLQDFQSMWTISIKNLRAWNKQISVIGEVISCCKDNPTSLVCDVTMSTLRKRLKDDGCVYYLNTNLLDDLLNDGLLTAYTVDETRFCVSFKNLQVKRALSKAGQIFELKTYLRMKMMKRDNGDALFNSILNGVVIDWDGKTDQTLASNPNAYEVENEIDVMAMRDMTPVFVSCKNGAVYTSELYKLSAVAKLFGGEHAYMILALTSQSLLKDKGNNLVRRANDMNIRIIRDCDKLTDEEFIGKLSDRLSG